jgi:hypothetical protein
MNEKISLSEYTKTNSIHSAMRLAFLWMVKLTIGLAIFTAVSIVGTAIANAFITKQITLPIAGMIGLVGSIATVAFGGKALQSFSEKEEEPTENQISK